VNVWECDPESARLVQGEDTYIFRLMRIQVGNAVQEASLVNGFKTKDSAFACKWSDIDLVG
jgi:hypothetical protein